MAIVVLSCQSSSGGAVALPCAHELCQRSRTKSAGPDEILFSRHAGTGAVRNGRHLNNSLRSTLRFLRADVSTSAPCISDTCSEAGSVSDFGSDTFSEDC